MPPRIFISYRRAEAQHQAKALYGALVRVVQSDDVFMDTQSIPPNTDFVRFLQDKIAHSELVLVLIGAGWAGSLNPRTGKPRLDDGDDFVRAEIKEAFARNIPVVPVLLDGAPMPHSNELPEDIRSLT